MLTAFHDFVARYHAEETLMFWLAVEVFKNRNWKAAKFFGMDADPLPISKAPPLPPSKEPAKKPELERRKSRKEKRIASNAEQALQRQRKLDQSAANRMGVSLEQLYLVKEADFIFDNFIKRDGAYWTCLDANTAKEIEDQLMDPGSLKRTLFEKAQNQAFNGMNDDLMPRFIKEIVTASTQDSIPLQLQPVCARFDELRKAPNRRKTGVSTALAFVFRRRTSTEKDSKLQTVSSREMGQLKGGNNAAKDTGKPVDATKATTLLRQRSHLALLGPEGGSVGALGLSRSRLSQGASEMAQAVLEVNRKRSGIASPAPTVRKGGDRVYDLKKRSSAPTSNAEGGDRDSLSRKVEIGIQRSRSDRTLLTHGKFARAKEFGLDAASVLNGGRNTVSKLESKAAGESVTLVIDRASRKNSV
jgi:hypothetical protein